MRSLRNGIVIGTLALALGGCGIFGGGGDKKPKTPTFGDRIPILTSETGVEVDAAVADVAVVLPPALPNPDWAKTRASLPAPLNAAPAKPDAK